MLLTEQHDFKAKRGCETQFATAVDTTSQLINIGKRVDVIILDLKKSFDKVSHPKQIQ